jgi:DNA-binding transcriptional MerR regulator
MAVLRRKTNPKTSRPQLRLYARSAVCALCSVTEHELALWESEELVAPARLLERGHRLEPLYDDAALARVRLIRTLAEELEVNVPGIGVILHLLEQFDR